MMSGSDYNMDLMGDGSDRREKSSTTRSCLLLAIGVVVCALVAGILIGHFGISGGDGGSDTNVGVCLGPDVPSNIIDDADPTVQRKITERMSADNIRENLRRLTLYPHVGGTPGEERLADDIYATWRAQGLDHVTNVTYDVLLSFPDETNPSTVELVNDNGDVVFACQIKEKNLTRGEEGQEDVVLPFNSYSAPGNIEGNVIYVNYGRVEDFMLLRDNYRVNFNDSIVIARYGKIFRGDKVSLAHQFGAAAVLLYTDPADYSIPGATPYPESWWLPATGVQRGTVFGGDGDPLTPGYPSVEGAYHWQEEDVLGLPKIPAHPISYGDAQEIMRHLSGSDAPADWWGDMNITYNIGGAFQNTAWRLQMNISTSNQRSTTTNVFGYIEGSVEPDRYVILGNHRDAWVFGAVDPTSGTATMLELSRVLMDIVKEGWRPRRTIIFCSWGAEEFGLIGSYEWVENFPKNLGERAVAYLNVDMTFEGNHSMRGRGVPLLYDLLYDVAKEIPTPNDPEMSMYDEWVATFPDAGTDKPVVRGLGSGSDYAAFMNFAGIPGVDVRYTYDDRWDISDYPLYHSAYETYYLVENFIDPNFEYSRAIGVFWGELARRLADSLVLPMNSAVYGDALVRYVDELQTGYGDLMATNNVTLDFLQAAVTSFNQSAIEFETNLQQINRKNPVEIRAYNDQLMLLERAFLDHDGLPLRPAYKHLIFAPSTHDAYAGTSFPGLVDLMFDIDGADDEAERWQMVRRHLATLSFTIQSAAATLAPPTLFN